MENGDPGVSVGTLAMVFLTLGESGRLADLLDIGLALSVSTLPRRVRSSG
ncbi:hypothetical protein FACS1894116_13170 [Betaproteobacteria bacterium]|nr:hypothetical protein FACS1894116_13170 [Betaproteobacteria bacterium]